MANEIVEFGITTLAKLTGVSSYHRWAPNKVQRVRYEFGNALLDNLDSNECDKCDYPMTADNVDVRNNRAIHVECPIESQYVVPMVGFKPVGKFKVIK